MAWRAQLGVWPLLDPVLLCVARGSRGLSVGVAGLFIRRSGPQETMAEASRPLQGQTQGRCRIRSWPQARAVTGQPRCEEGGPQLPPLHRRGLSSRQPSEVCLSVLAVKWAGSRAAFCCGKVPGAGGARPGPCGASAPTVIVMTTGPRLFSKRMFLKLGTILNTG